MAQPRFPWDCDEQGAVSSSIGEIEPPSFGSEGSTARMEVGLQAEPRHKKAEFERALRQKEVEQFRAHEARLVQEMVQLAEASGQRRAAGTVGADAKLASQRSACPLTGRRETPPLRFGGNL